MTNHIPFPAAHPSPLFTSPFQGFPFPGGGREPKRRPTTGPSCGPFFVSHPPPFCSLQTLFFYSGLGRVSPVANGVHSRCECPLTFFTGNGCFFFGSFPGSGGLFRCLVPGGKWRKPQGFFFYRFASFLSTVPSAALF